MVDLVLTDAIAAHTGRVKAATVFDDETHVLTWCDVVMTAALADLLAVARTSWSSYGRSGSTPMCV